MGAGQEPTQSIVPQSHLEKVCILFEPKLKSMRCRAVPWLRVSVVGASDAHISKQKGVQWAFLSVAFLQHRRSSLAVLHGP
jgi:hypothetical protein